MITFRHRCILFLAAVFIVETGLSQRAGAQFLCSVAGGGSPDGVACEADADCGAGVCVIAQGVCNGGADDGLTCDCAGGTCAATPACTTDASMCTCSGGTSAGERCEVTSNCTGGRPCTGSQKVCLAGANKGFSCLNDGQCPSSQCRSTGKFCDGGTFADFSCVDSVDCPGGVCTTAALTPTPTRTRGGPTATRTPSPSTTTPTPRTATPTGTVVTPTPGVTSTPLGTTARLASVINDAASNIPLGDASAFPAAGAIQIDNEVITYQRKDHNTLRGAVRGVNGTAAVAHAGGALVTAIVLQPTAAPPPPQPHIFRVIGKGGGCSIRSKRGNETSAFLIWVALAAWGLRRRQR